MLCQPVDYGVTKCHYLEAVIWRRGCFCIVHGKLSDLWSMSYNDKKEIME